jgi:hypothetical protein
MEMISARLDVEQEQQGTLPSMPVNVVCMKWGSKYPSYYVNRLFWGVRRFLRPSFRFICFTDQPNDIVSDVEVYPLPEEPFETEMMRLMTEPKRRGAWRKISLFRPGVAGMVGPVLGFDLDVAITGPLDDLLNFAPGKVAMRRDWLEARRGRFGGHGSVFRYDLSLHGYLYSEFAADPRAAAERSNGSEQKYTSTTAMRHGDFVYFPPHWIASFKRNAIPLPPLNFFIEPRLPHDTRVMCFHGKPKMEEAIAGYREEWLHGTRPSRWLRDFWLQETL